MLQPWLIQIADIVGIIGVTLTLFAYFGLQANRLSSEEISYFVLNLLGSGLILYSLFFHWNTPSILLEAAWLIISLWGVIKTFRRTIRRSSYT